MHETPHREGLRRAVITAESANGLLIMAWQTRLWHNCPHLWKALFCVERCDKSAKTTAQGYYNWRNRRNPQKLYEALCENAPFAYAELKQAFETEMDFENERLFDAVLQLWEPFF